MPRSVWLHIGGLLLISIVAGTLLSPPDPQAAIMLSLAFMAIGGYGVFAGRRMASGDPK